jgi:hypothetical protein
MSGTSDEQEWSSVHHTPPADERRVYNDGEWWTVREIAAPAFDRRGGTHLIFESVGIVRRVREFPPNWILLGDDELLTLSLHI